MSYDNTNQIALFKNVNKESDNHPDYSGTLNVDGREFFVDCWLKTIQKGERSGQKFLSGKVKPKQQRGGNQGGGGYKSQGGRRDSHDDDGW
jgi:hypothetical protein